MTKISNKDVRKEDTKVLKDNKLAASRCGQVSDQ